MLSFAATTDLIAFNNASADFGTGFGFDLDTPTFYEVAPQATFPCGESSNPTDCLKGGNNITNFCEDANAPGLEEDQPNLTSATNSTTSEWGVWQGFVEASEAPAQSRVRCGTEARRAALAGASKCCFKRGNPATKGSFTRGTLTTLTTTTPCCFMPSSYSPSAPIAGSIYSGGIISGSGSGGRQLQQHLLLH